MPTQVVNTEPISKLIRVKNTGIRAVEFNWQIFDSADTSNLDRDFFNLSIGKNSGLNKGEYPYKFTYDFIEPQESADSIYEISPKQAVMGPREVQTFTVTFSPNKPGKEPGMYKSIVMASPSLTNDELLIAEDAEEFKIKGALGIVAFNLVAESIKPILTIDKKERIDGYHHVNFKYWSYRGDPEAPSPI
jgi:hypothetical protein